MSKFLLKINTYTQHPAYQYYKYMIVDDACDSVIVGFCNHSSMINIRYLNELRYKYMTRFIKPRTKKQISNLRKKRWKYTRYVVK